jgi:hypothetical protein
MQKHSKVFGMSATRRVCQVKQCGVGRLAFLHNTMKQWSVSSKNAILNLILILGFKFHMPNLFCVVCFRVQSTTKEVFVVNVV